VFLLKKQVKNCLKLKSFELYNKIKRFKIICLEFAHQKTPKQRIVKTRADLVFLAKKEAIFTLSDEKLQTLF